MIKAIAIDDEPLALTIIEHLCKTASNLSLLQTFTDQDEAIDYLSKHSIDILFLDIQMPQKNGIDFYKSLPIEKKPAVIFTTAYQEYAIDGFEVNAIDYLLKPIDQNRFEKAIEKALWWLQKEGVNPLENSITIRADYKNNNIILEDIQYIEGLDDYVQIYLENKPKLVARMSMKNMIELLPSDYFTRIHRSYIVPIKKIETFDSKQISIQNKIFPIGDTYKEEVNVKLNKK